MKKKYSSSSVLPLYLKCFNLPLLFWLITSTTQAQSPDTGVESIEAISNICPGTYPIKAVIQNFGGTAIDTVTINWSVDGVTQTPKYYYEPLTSISEPVELGDYSFAIGRSYNIKVWTSMPENQIDTVNLNDTATAILNLNPPSGLAVSNITTASADISFGEMGSVTSTIIYGTQGFNPATSGTAITSVSTFPFALTGLSPNTSYDIYIAAECGSGNSDTAGPVTFKTACLVSLPFSENFNNSGLNCFRTIGGGSSDGTWSAVSFWNRFYKMDGTPFVVSTTDIQAINSHYEILESPVIDAGAIASKDFLLLDFEHVYESKDNGADSGKVQVYDGNQWHTVYMLKDANVGKYGFFALQPIIDHQVIDITAYANANLQVRFIYGRDQPEGGSWAIDNISVTVPDTCIAPLTVILAPVDSNSVTVRLNGGVSAFGYEIGTSGFSPGTGSITGTKAGNPSTIDGLTMNTLYDIYLRTDCGSANYSSWAGPFTFLTGCLSSMKLSGTYTIDATQPTSGTNFSSFTEVSQYLNNCGINGPVVFNVFPGTYNDNLILTDIPGASPVNTITFRGTGVNNAVLTSASTEGIPTVYLNGADHVIIKNMTIANSYVNNTSYGILLQNSANNNIIDSCTVKMPRITGGGGIVAKNLITAYGDNARNFIVSNCTITGGGEGIALYGNNIGDQPNPVMYHIIKNNVLRAQSSGITVRYANDILISNNEVDSATLYAIDIGYTNDYELIGNKAVSSGDAVNLAFCGNHNGEAISRSKVTNNIFISESSKGMNVVNTEITDIFHNSVSGSLAAINIDNWPNLNIRNVPNLDIRNNIFHSVSGFAFEAVTYNFTTTVVNVIDYNLYYSAADMGFLIEANMYADLSVWQTEDSTHNVHSIEGYSVFTDTRDLHIIYSLANDKGDPFTGVAMDIDGDSRSSTPDIGADEFIPPACIPSVNLTTINVYGDSAKLVWIPGSGSSYNLWYGPAGFFEDSILQGTKITGITDTFYTLTGLAPGTAYDIYISDNCGTGDTSVWFSPLSLGACRPKLSGNYTIDITQPTGDRNFRSFDDASQKLINCGISGPVVFNVLPGTYNEHLILTDIVGSSTTNTVTFRGAGISNTMLTDSSIDGMPTVYLNGADHIILKNMTISNTGATSNTWGVLLKSRANHNTIDNCHIVLPTTISPNVAGIVATNNLKSVLGYGGNASYLKVSNCTITGGHTGIYLTGSTNAQNANHIIENNIFHSQGNTGIATRYIDDIIIRNNDIDSDEGNGIYMVWTNNFEILQNRVLGTIRVECLNETELSQVDLNRVRKVVNNMVISRFAGINIFDGKGIDVYHNSVIGSPAIFLSETQTFMLANDIRNNIFYSPTDYAFRLVSINGALDSETVVDYNMYYSNNENMFDLYVASYTDLSSWQSADGLRNTHSIEGNPLFVSEEDLHTTGLLAHEKGYPIIGVTEDFDGDARSTVTPDIGADEYTPLPCPGVGIFLIENPLPDGATFRFDKNGDRYDLEFGPCGFEQGTGTIVNDTVAPVTISGLNSNSCYDFYVRRNCGSGQVSTFEGPFTYTTSCPGKLSGTYTIGYGSTAGNNFSSVSEAASILNHCGIEGPVVFNIAPGTYIGNITLKKIPGASPNNRVTFRGASISGTILKHSSIDNLPTVLLDGANYITFRNLTIANTGLNGRFAWGVFLRDLAEYNTIDSCLIEMPISNVSDVAGIATGNSIVNQNSPGDNANFLTVSNCTIIGGESGVFLIGNGNSDTTNIGHVIQNNVFRKQNKYGIYTVSMIDLLISGNDIDSIINPSASWGMMILSGNNIEISKNRIIVSLPSPGGNIGIQINSVAGGSSNRIINNMIISSSNGIGIRLFGEGGLDVFHNSVVGSPAIQLNGFAGFADIRNNIFYSSNSHAFYVFGMSGNGFTAVIDYNLYYSPHGFVTSTGTYSDLADWQSASPHYNSHSITDNPLFVSPDDLHIIYSSVLNNGDPSVGITVDIDEDQRSATSPHIGADEFTLPSCIPSTELHVVAVYTDSITLNWKSGSGNTYNLWYGSPGFFQNPLLGGTKITGITDTSYTLTGLTPNTVYDIYVSDYCGNTDTSVWYSSVIVKTACTAQLSGHYTIDAAHASGGSNFNSFSETVLRLKSCGISGPVVFDVMPGTYTSNVNLTEISGVSFTNTITFRGSGPDSTILTSSQQDLPTVYLDGADHISFKNMTIANTNAGGEVCGVLLKNSANYNTIDSCNIEVPVTTVADVMGIVAGSSLKSIIASGTGNNAHYLTISNCTITGGQAGVYLIGDISAYNSGHIITNNIFRNQDDMGIGSRYIQDIRITRNDIDNVMNTGSGSANGMFLKYIKSFEISRNRIVGPDHGLYIEGGNEGNSTSTRSGIVNNIVISNSGYGLSMEGIEKTNIYNNSIVGNGAIEMGDHLSMDIRNNILYSTPSGNPILKVTSTLGSSYIIDYNIYYSSGSVTSAFNLNIGQFADLAAWKAVDASSNVHSIEGDPGFTSPNRNLHITDSSIAIDAGDSISGVIEDIDGHPRPAPDSYGVDIGADEFFITCTLSENLILDSVNCNSAIVSWTSGTSGSYSIIEYDTAGFSRGQGRTKIFGLSPMTLYLDSGTTYQIYLSDTCGIDTIMTTGPLSFTTPTGPIEADYSFTINLPTSTYQTVNFDGTSSQGAQNYTWDFGDGSPTTNGMIASHNYTVDGTYSITLTVKGACGTNQKTDTVVIYGISLEENILNRSLEVYPNPTVERVYVSFETGSSGEVMVQLTDLSGKVVMQQRITDSNGRYKGEINMKYFPKGTYILQVKSADVQAVRKVVKQ